MTCPPAGGDALSFRACSICGTVIFPPAGGQVDFIRVFDKLHKIVEYCANSTSLPAGRRGKGYLRILPFLKTLPK
jgi:hypothetical protein